MMILKIEKKNIKVKKKNRYLNTKLRINLHILNINNPNKL